MYSQGEGQPQVCIWSCKVNKDEHRLAFDPMFSILVLATSELHLPFGQRYLRVQRAALRYTFSTWEIRSFVCGSHTAEAYSSCGLTRVLHAISLTFGNFALMFLQIKPKDRFALFMIRSMCGFHVKLFGTGNSLQDLSMENIFSLNCLPGACYLYHLPFRRIEFHPPSCLPCHKYVKTAFELG